MFCIFPKELLKNREIKDTSIKIYLCLQSFSNEERYCFPSINKIGEICGCSYRTVTRALQNLEECGAIKRVNQYRKDGGRGSNIYYLELDPTTPPESNRQNMSYPIGQKCPNHRTKTPHFNKNQSSINKFNNFIYTGAGARACKDIETADVAAVQSMPSGDNAAELSKKMELAKPTEQELSAVQAAKSKFGENLTFFSIFKANNKLKVRKVSNLLNCPISAENIAQFLFYEQGVECDIVPPSIHYEVENVCC